jgi:hypothetical protein
LIDQSIGAIEWNNEKSRPEEEMFMLSRVGHCQGKVTFSNYGNTSKNRAQALQSFLAEYWLLIGPFCLAAH